MEIIELQARKTISPDNIEVSEWGYKLLYNQKDAITVSYNRERLIISKQYHGQLPITEGFFARIWLDSKVISWWYNPEYNPYIMVWEIIDILQENKRCTLCPEAYKIGNLREYTAVFLKDALTIVRMPVHELSPLLFNFQHDNRRCRNFHIIPPYKKKKLEKTDASMQMWKHLYYLEDCKVWTKRIGSMDVAEYHLYYPSLRDSNTEYTLPFSESYSTYLSVS